MTLLTPDSPKSSAEDSPRKSHLAKFSIVVLLAIHSGLAIHTAFRSSVTNDEFWHIPTGLWIATTGEFHYENLNPPLVRVLSALPLLASGAEKGDVPADAPKEVYSEAFVKANGERYSQLISISRLVPILLSVCTGLVLGWFAWDLFGPGAAVMATALWCLSPNIIAHGSLVTTDVAAAGATLMAIRAAWRFAETPTLIWSCWMGLWIGIALLVKYTCVLCVPFALATWILLRFRNENVARAGWPKSIALWIISVAAAILIVNAGYLFQGTGNTLGDYQFQSKTVRSLSEQLGPLHSVPIPFPVDFMEGIDHQRRIMEENHVVYLDGEMRFEEGFRDYYLKAWWYKTPHATQFACVLALLFWLLPGRTGRQTRVQLALLFPVVSLLAIASLSSMQLGIRYLIPVFPLLFVFASQIASAGKRTFGFAQLLSLLIVVGVASSLRYHPFHLTYFNEYAGGPQEGHLHLIDSNLDWGQGLLELKDYLEENEIEDLSLAYFGSVNPADLGIEFRVPPNSDPPRMHWPPLTPGVYAISANFLMGRPGNVSTPAGESLRFGAYQFRQYFVFTPDESVANCIFIYEIDEADIARYPRD